MFPRPSVLVANRALRELIEAVFAPASAELFEVHDRLEAAGTELVRRATEQGTMRPDAQGLDIGIMMRCVVAAADMTEGDGWRRYLALMLDGLRAPGTTRPPLPMATGVEPPRFAGT